MPRPCPGPALLMPVVAARGGGSSGEGNGQLRWTPPPPHAPGRLNRQREGRPGGGRASEQPPLVQPPLDPEQPPLAPGAAAPGAATPGPRAAAPGPWSSHPWPLEQPPLVQPPLDLSSRPWPLEQPPQHPATPPLDPVPPPPCAAHCRPLLPVAALPPPPFFVSLLRVQPWNEGYGGGGYGVMGGLFPFPSLPPPLSPTAAAAAEGGGCVGAKGVVLGGEV
ncbi:unnamed protein product [Closterium sp. NIES-53]